MRASTRSTVVPLTAISLGLELPSLVNFASTWPPLSAVPVVTDIQLGLAYEPGTLAIRPPSENWRLGCPPFAPSTFTLASMTMSPASSWKTNGPRKASNQVEGFGSRYIEIGRAHV